MSLRRMETRLLELLDVCGLGVKTTYTVADVAKILGTTERSVRRLIEQNRLSSIRLFEHHRIPYYDLVRYIHMNDTYNRDYGHREGLYDCFIAGIEKINPIKDYTPFLDKWVASQVKE